jgi:hypothetical protein
MMELMHSTIGVALFLIGVALSFVIPFSPSIVAFYRKHNKRGTILVWNIIISIVLATPIGLAATTPTGTAPFLMLLLFIAHHSELGMQQERREATRPTMG